MIQWGYNKFNGSVININLPISFYNSSYNVFMTFNYNSDPVITAYTVGKSTSYFQAESRGVIAGNPPTFVSTTEYFQWFAIGRWK